MECRNSQHSVSIEERAARAVVEREILVEEIEQAIDRFRSTAVEMQRRSAQMASGKASRTLRIGRGPFRLATSESVER